MGLIKTAVIVGGGAYAVNKLAKRHEQKKAQARNANPNNYAQDRDMSQQQYFDSPPLHDQYQYQADSKGQKSFAETQSQVQPLVFVDRRTPYEQQNQPLYLNNSYQQPLPQSSHAYVQSPPPEYLPAYHQRQQPHGFVEPDELSQTDNQSLRTPRGSSGGQGLLNTLAQQAMGRGRDDRRGKSPREYLEKYLAK